ncbi:MAG TPA: hypothetical protein PLL08_07105, partial [Bacteroidales bacterium]|nr:hypothetical protein [Bacteroidales bacterium]
RAPTPSVARGHALIKIKNVKKMILLIILFSNIGMLIIFFGSNIKKIKNSYLCCSYFVHPVFL